MKMPAAPPNYPDLVRALESFDSSPGFSAAEADNWLQRVLAEPGCLDRTRGELELALADPDTPWPLLLVNERYEAGDELEPEQAKAEVLRLLWDSLHAELPPLPGGRSLRMYEVSEAGKIEIMVEDSSNGEPVTRISRLTRAETTLVVV